MTPPTRQARAMMERVACARCSLVAFNGRCLGEWVREWLHATCQL